MSTQKTTVSRAVIKQPEEQKVYYQLTSPKIRVLTVKAKKVHKEVALYTAIKGAELGKIFKEIKAGLEHGNWFKWLERNQEFSFRHVERCINIYDFSVDHPGEYRSYKIIGFSKLAFLATLPVPIMKALLKKRTFRMPGTNEQINIITATRKQLEAIAGVLLKKPDFDFKAAARGFRQSMSTWEEKIEAMEKHRKEVDKEEVGELVVELKKLTIRLGKLM